MIFLSAHWSHLILINYAVEPEVLEPICPRGTVPDTREGMAFVSLVAFDFLKTRVLGIPWPGYTDFPEINLRFYVRHGNQRGVSFVRELVPRRLIAWMARATYNEPYQYLPMQSRLRRRNGRLYIRHDVCSPARLHTIRLIASDRARRPPEDSWEHFFKEHQWGFGVDHSGRTMRYEVRHPHWDIFPVLGLKLSWDFAELYGRRWEFLNGGEPHSVVLAKGSPIMVLVKGRL